jgi:protoporphyrinogen oxidase
MQGRAIIIGAGPAGLTAAYELCKRSAILPIVLEKSEFMGGIARTVNYRGNRIDIGGHRFFSKSDRVMNWWVDILPLEAAVGPQKISYQQQERWLTNAPAGPNATETDRVMLVRRRKSRIYFLRKFFDYPIRMNAETIRKLGLWRVSKIAISYLRAVCFPIRNEQNLEEFLINRFGRQLYLTFFKSYTEKVWGVPCNKISAEWGAQRIKGLSITKALGHFLRQKFASQSDVRQKNIETSLIEQFLYPKLGPGQMWEEVAERVTAGGGQILTGYEVLRLHTKGQRITGVEAVETKSGKTFLFEGDYFFSTMPVSDLVRGLEAFVPERVREVSRGLVYRDFITVGLLMSELKVKGERGQRLIEDNWVYVQEPDVQVGRLQIFNNWSPAMVRDPLQVWIGLEYFCYETDEIWKKPDAEMVKFAIAELEKIGIIDSSKVVDSTVLRMPKTYPGYFGTYHRFDEVREFLDTFTNLFLVGRNGMHKYNNQDHSMLTAMTAVDNILSGRTNKENIWSINTEQDYHEDGRDDSRSGYSTKLPNAEIGTRKHNTTELVHK